MCSRCYACVCSVVYFESHAIVCSGGFPSERLLERCTKEELLQIAEQFDVEVTSSDKKLKEMRLKLVKSALSERGVLEVRAQVINPEEAISFPLSDVDQNAKFNELSLQEK